MKYTDYEAEDFLMDESFRNYCLGKNEKDMNFWEGWIAANPGKYDETRQAKEMYFLLNGNTQPGQLLKDQQSFRAKLEQHIISSNKETAELINTTPRKKGITRRLLLYTGVAAASVLAMILVTELTDKPAKQPVPLQFEYLQASKVGERKSFQLPDGSKVMLNAGSTINIAESFNNKTRELTLEGEAFFDVVHNPGKPFIIHTSSMDVKVLGTTFNVKAYPADKITETSLLKGSVEIILNKDRRKTIILRPNEKIVLPNLPEDISPSKKAAVKNNTAKPVDYTIAGLTYMDSSLVEISWTENRLVFNDDNFEDMAAALERWYNVSIGFEDDVVKQYRFTAIFDQKNITQVLDALQLSRHFEYTIRENNQIIIRNR